MATAWRLRRGGELDQFYTSELVARSMVNQIGNAVIQNVLDLGAGEGTLALSVLSRSPDANLVSVDLDAGREAALRLRVSKVSRGKHSHIIHDVFDPKLPEVIGADDFDLAVCNPPFFKPVWRDDFLLILRSAGLESTCGSNSECTAEAIFLAQNLRLLRDGGRVALIVPSGIATGHKFRRFRRAVMAAHTIVSVLQLPSNSFGHTEAHCFILLIQKGRPQSGRNIALMLAEAGNMVRSVEVSPSAAVSRMDYSFYATNVNSNSLETLRVLGADVRRGSFSSVQKRAADFPIFHTGDFPPDPARLSLPTVSSERLPQNAVVAQAGDILMGRVDRNLQDKLIFVQDGHSPITDCVFRIRVPRSEAERVFLGLSKSDARERIKATAKGVGARVLGKGDLLDLPLFQSPPLAVAKIPS